MKKRKSKSTIIADFDNITINDIKDLTIAELLYDVDLIKKITANNNKIKGC